LHRPCTLAAPADHMSKIKYWGWFLVQHLNKNIFKHNRVSRSKYYINVLPTSYSWRFIKQQTPTFILSARWCSCYAKKLFQIFISGLSNSLSQLYDGLSVQCIYACLYRFCPCSCTYSFFCFYSILFLLWSCHIECWSLTKYMYSLLLLRLLRLPILPVYNIFYLYNIVCSCLKYINKALKIYIVFITKSVPDLLPLFFLTVLTFPFPYAYLHMIPHFLDLVHHAMNIIFLCEIFSNPCTVLC
jgi:hypothetical protein